MLETVKTPHPRQKSASRWVRRAGWMSATVAGLLTGALLLGGFMTPPGESAYVVFGYNELGMHCMNQDFSELMILPPFNTVRAQVVRRGGEPDIMTGDVTVRYSVPGNTHSSDKTNFWTYAEKLFGVPIPPDVGLTGNRLSGTMVPRIVSGHNDWEASGVPITPISDDGRETSYSLATILVERNGSVVARTQAVVPVSWEISCFLCHTSATETVGKDILRKHDTMHGTTLLANMPVNCASCHADAALGTPGTPGVKSLSHAMHGSHANRMAAAGLAVNCYACHPGVRTQCQRDIHSARGMTCLDCHGDMAQVAAPSRRPWLDEPSCRSCHQARRPNFEFEPVGVLFREAEGHGGIKCVSCHSSPHAVTPTSTGNDNLQAVRLQGHPGRIDSCTVCHTTQPSESFFHKRED